MSLGERIFNLRRKKELTQEQLAERIGVTKQVVIKWELGLNLPGYKNFRKICSELGVSESEFAPTEDEIARMKELDEVFAPAEETPVVEKESPSGNTLKAFLVYSLSVIGVLAAACIGFMAYLVITGTSGKVIIELDFMQLMIILSVVLVIALIGVILAAIVGRGKKRVK